MQHTRVLGEVEAAAAAAAVVVVLLGGCLTTGSHPTAANISPCEVVLQKPERRGRW